MNAVLLIREYFFIVLLFFIAPTNAFSLDLTCKYVETIIIELFDENNKSLGVSIGGKAKNQRPYSVSIDETKCIVNETKFKLVKMEGAYLCSNKQKRKDWDSYESVWIDRYTGVAEITNRLIAYKGTVNSNTEARYVCKKGKAKKKF